MKIAIYHDLPSGGAKRTLYELCKRLAPRHEIWVYSLSTANQEFGDLRPLVVQNRVYEFQPSRMYKSPFGRLNQLQRLKDLHRLEVLNQVVAADMLKENFDLYFIHPCQFENSPSVLHYLEGLPTVYFCQEPIRVLYEEMPPRPYDKPESRLRTTVNKIDPLPGMFRSTLKKNDQRNLRAARMVLVNSQHILKQVKEIYGVDAIVNYLGVDADFFHPLNMEKQGAVVSVGSLTPLKGYDFLIRSLAHIPANERPPLWIASNFTNPPEYEYLTGLAGDLGVTLQLHGGISDTQLVELYNQASLTVYAPVREPFGLVAIESMACGTAVIGVREGGLQETIQDGVSGRLVERDEISFANAIQNLICEPQLTAEYGNSGRRQVMQKWTWNAATDRLENNFRLALQNQL
jgi:glycosyltransferase involved in cell wall biosynthesis